jgi:TolB-like protein/Tfp pilus assembly protein PilF
MSFWRELRRRNVFKVAAAYAIVAWLLVQVASVVFPALLLPAWTVTFVTVLIITGFPVALFLAWAFELTPEGIKPAAALSAEERGPRGSSARLNYLLAGLLVLAVGYIVVDRIFLTPSSAIGSGGPQGGISRLAVLPCDNLSPDPNDSYFAPGIHEELLNRLARIGNLRLTSRSSVQQYADTATRPAMPAIGTTLGVDAIIECSVRYAADELLFTAQLVDAQSDTHLWSDSYRADMSDLADLFQIQAEIAMNVANAVRIGFFAEEIERISRRPTESREAYELYLAAQGLSPARQFNRVLYLLDQALAIDSGFVEAWLAKAVAHQFRGASSPPDARSVEETRAFDAIDKALQLDPEDGRGYAARGRLLGLGGRWLEAQRNFARARELGVPLGQIQDGVMQMAVGHFERARDSLEAQLAIDPMNRNTATFLMMTYAKLGDLAARERAFARGASLYAVWPDPLDDLLIRLGEGNVERLRAFSGMPRSEIVVASVANLDAPGSGLAALRELHTDPRQHSAVTLFVMSAWAAYFGDPALSLEWLAEGALPGNMARVWYPAFDAVRREPGFAKLLEDQGLPEYWDENGWPPFCARRENDSFACE